MAAHVKWAKQLRQLGEVAGDGGVLIREVRAKMPEVLRQSLTGSYTTWVMFCAAVRAISVETLQDKKWQINRLAAIEDQLKMRQESEDAIAALTSRMTSISIERPVAQQQTTTPRVPYTPRGPFQTPSSSPTTPQQRATPWVFRAQAVTVADRAPQMTVETSPPPLTEAGWATYKRNITDYNKKWGPNAKPTVANPYPLSPGTVERGSGECYACGKRLFPWHGAAQCPGLYVPQTERDWRVDPVNQRRSTRFTPATPGTPSPIPVGVVVVEQTGEGLTVEEWMGAWGKGDESHA
ncbi:hypothetical protein BOTBODRAFT_179100 [Botryobasidium botryosum FD-172 SS1]|uniref:Uncharacterized protein n=1 Tax=Botryobasidium botryosum (strain FD-172 SS1) TaxID=930990 RepID=A0A067MC06_BOTB1|nr:hypothetical protein BOTBODRAFT_179100 [Botryobasidium botryosum FD-172 SS1]